MFNNFSSLFNDLMKNNQVGSLIEYLLPIISILVLISSNDTKPVIVLMLLDLIIKFARKGA